MNQRSGMLTVGLVAAMLFTSMARTAIGQQAHERWQIAMPNQLPQTPLVDRHRPVLYVAEKVQGLGIYRLNEGREAAVEIGRVDGRSLDGLNVMDVTQVGDLLFLALGDFFNARGDFAGCAIVNVSDPSNPLVQATWKSAERMKGCAVVRTSGNYVYLGAMNHGLITLERSTKGDKLKHISTVQPDIHFPRRNPGRVQHPNARGMWVENERMVVAYDAGGLRVLDVSNPVEPQEIGRYINAGMGNKQQAYNSVWLHDGLAYVTIDYAGLEIIDVRDPKNMRQIGWWNPWSAERLSNLWFNSPGHTNQIYLDTEKKLAFLSAGDSELLVVDVSNPRQPQLVSQIGEPKNDRGVWGVTANEEAIFLTYITSHIPFSGRWSGIKAYKR